MRGAAAWIGFACAGLLIGACAPKPATPRPTHTPAPPVANSPASPSPVAPTPQSSPTAPAPQTPAPPPLRELFPSVRADVAARLVEFDGIVPINCHDPVTPDVYLELIACTPDTREHESLVMTRAKPSHVHAALLAVGVDPGVPGSWKYENKKLIPIPPRGGGLDVRIAYRDAGGTEIEAPAIDWVVNARTGASFSPRNTGPAWLFAGSVIATRQGREVYDADGAGTLIGLCTFGSEVIAWADTISPEAMIDEPVWIANVKKVPAAGTAVVVRVRPATTP